MCYTIRWEHRGRVHYCKVDGGALDTAYTVVNALIAQGYHPELWDGKTKMTKPTMAP